MAKQDSIWKLKGTIGGVTFYKTKDGSLAREKTSVDGNRIATDPAFARTRENGAEFGRAGKAGKLLRRSMRLLMQNASDKRVTARMTQEMMRVLKADSTSIRGMRNVLDGELELLTGFEFNINSVLGTTLFAEYSSAIDRITGELKVDIPPFVPASALAAPAGSTHFKLGICGAAVNFETEEIESILDSTGFQPISTDILPAPLELSVNLTANSTNPLFLALSIEFYQEVNGQFYTLQNGAFNGMALVKVLGL
ncbi:hypothetical protein ACFSJU_07485 [Paradesertivirga mongoliensis]|uniref:Uncharacterized protein n=1 Tax=Paradesertivirga mongoliensis TaxID=2100740 RepID=A0ABW4ZJZ1_9SPHI|nr:hypothetical protein [Pedobacter mongoliensis]